MKLKTIGLVLGGLLGALLLAVVLFFVFFPKQLAAREAERRIEAATHRQLSLGHGPQCDVFPRAWGFGQYGVALQSPRFWRR